MIGYGITFRIDRRAGDLVATIYQSLGIDPHMTVPVRVGQPVPIAHGAEPILDLLA